MKKAIRWVVLALMLDEFYGFQAIAIFEVLYFCVDVQMYYMVVDNME